MSKFTAKDMEEFKKATTESLVKNRRLRRKAIEYHANGYRIAVNSAVVILESKSQNRFEIADQFLRDADEWNRGLALLLFYEMHGYNPLAGL